jgi:lysophospholipase L1-like esterase
VSGPVAWLAMSRVAAAVVVLATTALGLAVDTALASGASASIERVVTLGDSFSSGSGIHRHASSYDDHGPPAHSFDRATRLGSSACQRELDETPGPRLAARLGADSVFVACAGAVIDEIPAQVRAADIPGDGRGTLVTMTIGGNDLRTERGENWPDALLRCITSVACDRPANSMANLGQIRRDLTEVYVGIGDEYPGISVRVLGYPRLMQSDRWCEGVTGISRYEADFIDEQVDRLNANIAAAVTVARNRTGADLRFVPVVEEFDNRGACRVWQRDRFVNDAVFGESLRRSQLADGTVRDHWNDSPFNISTASFHPSSKGYDAYLGALTGSIAGLLGTTPTR